jgi:hypothetical protein
MYYARHYRNDVAWILLPRALGQISYVNGIGCGANAADNIWCADLMEYLAVTPPLYPNLLPEASIYLGRLKKTNAIAVTSLIGFGFYKSYWLITRIISENKKIKRKEDCIRLLSTIRCLLTYWESNG